MTEDIKTIKKKVNQDWQNAFPELAKYAQNKFYKTVGPTIVGLELIKLPRVEEYRPHLVIYPLWKGTLKECLNAPDVLLEFKNKKGLQFNIPYNKHSFYFEEVIRAIKEQSPIPFDGDIKLKSLLSLIDTYSKEPPLGAAPNSYLQAKLMEFKYGITLASSDDRLVEKVLSDIERRKWDSEHFSMWDIKVDTWLNALKNIDKDSVVENVNKIKSDKKLKKLLVSELK